MKSIWHFKTKIKKINNIIIITTTNVSKESVYGNKL